MIGLLLISINIASAALPQGVSLTASEPIYTGARPVYRYLFSNGLKLLVLPDERNPVAMLKVHIDAGGNREKQSETGLAHFFEHMMFRKTEGEPEGRYDRLMALYGGSANATTTKSRVEYYTKFPGPALDLMLDLERDRFLKLDLTDPYFTTEKGAVLSERKLRIENNPWSRGTEVIDQITETGTPWEWPTIGWTADIEGMTIEGARAFYNRYYRPENVTIIIGGPYDASDVVHKIYSRFGTWEQGEKSSKPGLPVNYFTRNQGKRFICSEAVSEQTIDHAYLFKPKSFELEAYAVYLSLLIDDDEDGALPRRLIKRDLAVGFDFDWILVPGRSFKIMASFRLRPDQSINAVEKYWYSELERKSASDFSRLKKMVLKHITKSERDRMLRMTSLFSLIGNFETVYGDYRDRSKLMAAYTAVKAQDFRKWLRDSIIPSQAVVTGIVPEHKAEPCSTLAVSLKGLSAP